MSGHRRLFSLLPTVPAVVWLWRTSQPLQRHFYAKETSINLNDSMIMIVFSSLSFSVVWLFFWSLKPEIKSPVHWSLLVQIQLHLLRFWYHSNQDLSSFHGLWLNFLNSLSFRISQMSQLTLFWHIFQGKKDVKKSCHSSNWIFFSCYSATIVLINTEKNWLRLHFSFCLPGHVQLQFAGWSANFVGRWPVQYCPQFWPALFTLILHPGFRGFPRSYLWFSDAVQAAY